MKIINDAIKKAVTDLGLSEARFSVEHPAEEAHGDYATNVAMVLAKQMTKRVPVRSGSPHSPESTEDDTSDMKSVSNVSNPRELAEKIKGELEMMMVPVRSGSPHSPESTEDDKAGLKSVPALSSVIDKIEVAGAGFINFYLKKDWLVEQLSEVGDKYGSNLNLEGRRVMVEYTDPNPFKEFHIGHLMTNTIGESLARLFAYSGAEIYRANYQGDVGLHVAKSIWGLSKKMEEDKVVLGDLGKWDLKKRVNYLGQSYALGATEYEKETTKAEIDSLNKKIYEKTDPEINGLYEQGREWSLEYFETIYERLGTKFDGYYFESTTGKVGLEVVEEGLKQGVFEESKGAIVFSGEKYGLHTRVFRNSLGLPTYEAKDLGLSKEKYKNWKYDQSFIVTANEIDEYFRVVLKAMSMLYPELAEKTVHLGHGMMKFPEGKMSSRTGNVVTGEGLIDVLKGEILKIIGSREIDDKEATADKIAVGAIKYMILKQGIGGDIVYDKDRVASFEGDTGPYLQYTHARCKSVLGKAGDVGEVGIPVRSPRGRDFVLGENVGRTQLAEEPHSPESTENDTTDLKSVSVVSNDEEVAVLRWLYRFPEVVVEAAREYAPNKVCSYLYELASRYNGFYNKHRVIGSEGSEQFRLVMTKAVGQVLKNGLGLLGIEAPTKM